MVDDERTRVEAARAGDEAAFADLVREHTPPVWRLARLLVGEDNEAEDVVQESFIRAHAALDDFRGDAPFRSWVLTICRRVCMDRLRRNRPEPLELVEPATPAGDGDPTLALAIRQAVTTLEPAEREAFVLVDVLGHNRRQAAEIVGVPASTVRSRVARAREHLAAQLDPHPPTPPGAGPPDQPDQPDQPADQPPAPPDRRSERPTDRGAH